MKIECIILEYLNAFFESEYFKIIFSFILGFLSNFGIAKIFERKKLIKLKRFYISWIRFSLVNVRKQQERMKIYNIQLENNFNYSQNLSFNFSQLDKLVSINKEDLFDIFVLRGSGNIEQDAKNLHELTGCIDYLILFDKEIYSKFQILSEEIKVLNGRLENLTNEFNATVDRYIIDYFETMKDSVDVILKLKEQLNNSTDIELDPEIYFEKFVSPVRTIFSEHLFKQKDNLVFSGRVLTQEFKDILDARRRSSIKFSSFLDYYINQIDNTVKEIYIKIHYFEKGS